MIDKFVVIPKGNELKETFRDCDVVDNPDEESIQIIENGQIHTFYKKNIFKTIES